MPTTTIIQRANTFLTWAAINGNANWRTSVLASFVGANTPDGPARAIEAVTTKLDKLNLGEEAEFGLAMTMTQALTDCFGDDVLPSEAGAVITLLKRENRIMQIGGGKGRCIVVLRAQFIANTTDTTGIAELDLKNVKRVLKSLESKLTSRNQDIEAQQKLIQRKNKQIEVLKQEMYELEKAAVVKTAISWS